MRVAQAKCIIRMDRMPAYQGEGKEKDGCKYVFQISLKGLFSSVSKYVLTNFNLICQQF